MNAPRGGAREERGVRLTSWSLPAPQMCPPGPHSAQSKGVPRKPTSAFAAGGLAGFLPPPCSFRVSLKASARDRYPLCSRRLSPPTPVSAASLSPALLDTW